MLGMRLNLDALGQFPQLLYIPVLRCFMAIRRTEEPGDISHIRHFICC